MSEAWNFTGAQRRQFREAQAEAQRARLAALGEQEVRCEICGHRKDGRVSHPPECGACPEGYCEKVS